VGPAPRRRDQRGVAVSSPVALLSMAAVVVAGAVFVLTNGDEPDTVVRASASTASSSTPTTSAPATPSAKRPTRHRPPVRRSGTYVEVFNNSGISGLAGSTAARAQGAGWQVVGSDNWYGTIPASTVYYPARLHRQAVLLAKDLGIARLKPSIAPMGGDRLTVILTRDYL
jgi:LytR cell envelope-related transcriptional attenuator